MLTAVAAFAEVFTHPAALGLVFALALLVTDVRRLRLAAAAVGVTTALPGLLEEATFLTAAAAIAGGAAGALLQAEVMLHLVLPAGRFAWHLAGAAWRLVAAAAGFLLTPGAGPPVPPDPRGLRPPPPPIEPEP